MIRMISHAYHTCRFYNQSIEAFMKDNPEVFGIVTVGQRGQVVIPMQARKTLRIKQ